MKKPTQSRTGKKAIPVNVKTNKKSRETGLKNTLKQYQSAILIFRGTQISAEWRGVNPRVIYSQQTLPTGMVDPCRYESRRNFTFFSTVFFLLIFTVVCGRPLFVCVYKVSTHCPGLCWLDCLA